jgi:hypothetical protein
MMAALMAIAKAERRLAASLITRFMAGQITNDEFVESYPTADADKALSEISDAMWGLYDDLSTHYVDPADQRSPKTMAIVSRCIRFLESDLEYRWPRFTVWRPMTTIYKIINRVFSTSYAVGDPNVWPFFDQDEFERFGSVATDRPTADS